MGERVPGKMNSWCKAPEAGRCSYVGGTERDEFTELGRVAHKGIYRLHPEMKGFRRAMTI